MLTFAVCVNSARTVGTGGVAAKAACLPNWRNLFKSNIKPLEPPVVGFYHNILSIYDFLLFLPPLLGCTKFCLSLDCAFAWGPVEEMIPLQVLQATVS